MYNLDALSYLCFIIQTFSIGVFAVFHRLQNCLMIFRKNSSKILRPFDMDFIRSRVETIQSESHEFKLKNPLTIGRFILFLTCPVLNAIAGLALKAQMLLVGCSLQELLIDALFTIYSINYGCFWYVVYVQRIAIQYQLDTVLRNLKRLAKKDDLDEARRFIDRVYTEYHLLSKVMGIWVAMTILTLTVLLLSTATFTFKFISCYKEVIGMDRALRVIIGFTCQEWLQIFMFCIIPLFALGGFNLEYLWQRFRHVIIRSKIRAQESFWLDVEQYVNQINTLGQLDLRLTVLFPILGFLVYNFFADPRIWGLRIYCIGLNGTYLFQNCSAIKDSQKLLH